MGLMPAIGLMAELHMPDVHGMRAHCEFDRFADSKLSHLRIEVDDVGRVRATLIDEHYPRTTAEDEVIEAVLEELLSDDLGALAHGLDVAILDAEQLDLRLRDTTRRLLRVAFDSLLGRTECEAPAGEAPVSAPEHALNHCLLKDHQP